MAKYGRLEVGQMYITTDGKTHILIHLEEGRTSPILGCCPNGTVDVDWGDGTAHDTLTGSYVTMVKWTPTHNYAAPGDYDIKLTVTGSMGFSGLSTTQQYAYILRFSDSNNTKNRVYQEAVRAVYVGSGLTNIGNYAFSGCDNFTNISISKSLTNLGNNAFQYCYGLRSVTIPNTVTYYGTYLFYYCYALASIALPKDMPSIRYCVFAYCYAIKNITIPDSVTLIDGSAFLGCFSASITIPHNVTSIGNNAFQTCHSLVSITIPDGVTSIGSNAFKDCDGLAILRFLATTPPSVSDSNAFSGVPYDCKIYVPAASLDTYKSATNYPSARSYTYIGE